MNKIKVWIKGKVVHYLLLICQLLPKKKAAVFTSFDGNQYSCNPKAISEKLHIVNPNIQIYWVFSNPDDIVCPSYIKKIHKGKLESLIAYGRSLIWVDNCNKPAYYYKSNRQLYIQTWHGDCCLKKLIEEKHIFPFDIGLSGSNFAEEYVYNLAFHYNGELLRYGSPRNDALINIDTVHADMTKKKLGIIPSTKILIFAPTFRDSRVGKAEDIYMPFNETLLLNQLEDATGSKWVLLYRGHHVTLDRMVIRDKERTKNVSMYPDMSDLLEISDILLTDYSSCCCDFILSGKPAILFHWSDDDYTKNDRDTIFPDNKLPFEIAYSESEIVPCIKKILAGDIKDYCKRIKSFYGSYETGNEAMETCKIINSWVNGNELDN